MKLKFYDLSSRKSFESFNYKIVNKSGKKFAVAKSPYSKKECWRIIG